jgi:hypothetical protein
MRKYNNDSTLSASVITDIISPPLQLTRKLARSRSHTAIDGQPISKCWCRAPSGAHDQIFITLWQLWSCLCGVASLTRDRICYFRHIAGPRQRSLSRVRVP